MPPPYEEMANGAVGGAEGAITAAEALDVKKVSPLVFSLDQHDADAMQARLEAKAREPNAEAVDSPNPVYSTVSDASGTCDDDDDDDNDDDDKKDDFKMW